METGPSAHNTEPSHLGPPSQAVPCGGLSCVFTKSKAYTQPAEKLSQVQTLVKVCNSFSSRWRLSLVLGKPLESILLPALYLEESEFSNAFSGQP